SVSGYGLPMALTLLRPELDVWQPGEHNGTFRGFNPAFVTAAAALEEYWRDGRLQKQTLARGEQMEQGLAALAASRPAAVSEVRG
ncbi:diaminobutyrate--2-oxoglutarate transaminase, partial [Streptomyces tunisiensis]